MMTLPLTLFFRINPISSWRGYYRKDLSQNRNAAGPGGMMADRPYDAFLAAGRQRKLIASCAGIRRDPRLA
jgi:hypothetical protein